jgi:hypothetical protein
MKNRKGAIHPPDIPNILETIVGVREKVGRE